jgi:hypothetical protein
VADVIGEDEEVFGDVEGLARAEEYVGKDRTEERVGAAAGSVEEQDGVVGMAVGSAVGFAKGQVVELQFGKRFP